MTQPMSSEMRELIRKEVEQWVGITRNRDIERSARVWMEGYDAALTYCAERISALLARTEAGADGADMIQWRYTNAETGEVLTPWTECDAAFREKRKDAPGYQFRELFAHPQDASGDAKFSAAELESLAKCVLASVTPGGFHIPEGWNCLLDKLAAMQAKEAK